MDKSKIKFIVLIVSVISLLALVKYFELGSYLDKENLQSIVTSAGIWAPIIFMLFYAIAPSLMLPGLPITILAGIMFGPLWGVVYVSIGATTGATIAFLIARYMGRGWIGKMIEGTKLASLDEKVEQQGWKIVALTRLIPLFPFNLLNYAFGLTNIKPSHYILASFIFMLPGITAFVIFSSSLLDVFQGNISNEFIIGALLITVVSLIPLVYNKLKKKKIA